MVKDALRPGTMPSYASDSGKRKRKGEPKASMAQRLAADSLWTLAECMDFTVEEIHAKLNRATTTEQQQVRDWADGGAPANADQGRCVFISPPFCNFRSYLTCEGTSFFCTLVVGSRASPVAVNGASGKGVTKAAAPLPVGQQGKYRGMQGEF